MPLAIERSSAQAAIRSADRIVAPQGPLHASFVGEPLVPVLAVATLKAIVG
ncbi:MAG TPA: hypothetical protein VHX88_19585 [Solirubrobacteraceae bacterium]|jgi:hypothetical protein|nr:hypothetical protein [Solirubrobacteraceae bacterium]